MTGAVRARVGRAAGAVALLAGCGSSEATDAGPPVDTIALPRIVMSANRPTKRFFIERTSDRCTVYFEEGGARSAGEDAPCVQDLLLGERIRLVGSTCVREASSEGRSIPVMCPNELGRFVKTTNLAAASAAAASASAAAAASGAPSASAAASAKHGPK